MLLFQYQDNIAMLIKIKGKVEFQELLVHEADMLNITRQKMSPTAISGGFRFQQ